MTELPWLCEDAELAARVKDAVVHRALRLLAAARLLHGVIAVNPEVRVAHGAEVRNLTDVELSWIMNPSVGRVNRGIVVESGSWVEVYVWTVRADDPCFSGALHVRCYEALRGLFGMAAHSEALFRELFRFGDARDGYDVAAQQMTDGYGISLMLYNTWYIRGMPNLTIRLGFALLQTLEELRNDGVVDGRPEDDDCAMLAALPDRVRAADAAMGPLSPEDRERVLERLRQLASERRYRPENG